jgi:hypothetical protein
MTLPPGVTVKSAAAGNATPDTYSIRNDHPSDDPSSSTLAAATGYDGSVLVLYGGSGPPNVTFVKASLGDFVPPVAGFDISQVVRQHLLIAFVKEDRHEL